MAVFAAVAAAVIAAGVRYGIKKLKPKVETALAEFSRPESIQEQPSIKLPEKTTRLKLPPPLLFHLLYSPLLLFPAQSPEHSPLHSLNLWDKKIETESGNCISGIKRAKSRAEAHPECLSKDHSQIPHID